MRADISTVIICDDVRKELSGKDILIGVYSGTVNVPAYPTTFPAAFWIEIEPEGAGSIHCEFTIATPSGNPPMKVGFDLDVVEAGTAVFVMGGVPLTLERDGDIVISAKIGNADETVVKRKSVKRVPLAASTPGQPAAFSS
ncbi:hypothetical protein [Aquamicrobium sp.]|uniref:DUF6941 family protein n=1 Tax=Aquamicrobium sp. TaxID=1872579 RepID=UPI00258B1575|nr:hypothetical protein [Aquamicrobium sp.]MCK9552252.1 hypothetical protein [Aquamicrobium sp.]